VAELFLNITLEHWDQVSTSTCVACSSSPGGRRTDDGAARGRDREHVSTNAFEARPATHYNTSKGAIAMLTRTMAVELGAHGSA
jgi:NAD(P)-dependent dehydrogenase (short-subunit alcohol dehydrogenase family)